MKSLPIGEVLKEYGYINEGQEVGQASYYINDEQVAAYPIYAAETVEKIDYGWCLRRCVTYFEREFQSMWQTWGV